MTKCNECGKEIIGDTFCTTCYMTSIEECVHLKVQMADLRQEVSEYSLLKRFDILKEKFDKLIAYIENKKMASTSKRNKGIKRKDRQYILDTNDNKCSICGRRFDKKYLHIDHIVPLAKGGRNEISNLQILCVECNLKKKDFIVGDSHSIEMHNSG